jgi:hypothetical protein
MTLKSRLLHHKPSNVQCTDRYFVPEQQTPTLRDLQIQLQAEIDLLQATVEQLEVPVVFHPPSRYLPVQERLDIHFQSIKTAKRRTKLLQQTQFNLAEKRQELEQIERQLISCRSF